MMLLLQGCLLPMDAFLFNPTKVDSYDWPDDVPADLLEEVRLPSGDLEIAGVWLRQGDRTTDHELVLFFHGNGRNLADPDGDNWERIAAFWRYGFDVFAIDYRGYGVSQGSPSRDGLLEDARAALEHAIEQSGRPASEIHFYGHSLGGFPALHLAEGRPPKSIVTESAWSSAEKFIDDGLGQDVPGGWMLEHPYTNDEAIRGLRAPYLLTHGRLDDFIDFSHADILYAAAPQPKARHTFSTVDHSDHLDVAPDEYAQVVTDWVTGVSRPD